MDNKELTESLCTGLAKHKLLSHFKSHHKTLPLYSSEYTDEEGIYIVGGLFGNGDEHIISFIQNLHHLKFVLRSPNTLVKREASRAMANLLVTPSIHDLFLAEDGLKFLRQLLT